MLKEEGCSKELNLLDFGRFEIADVDSYHRGVGRFGINLDTYYQSSYHSNERESRPKTKFFSLLIYAGYPIA